MAPLARKGIEVHRLHLTDVTPAPHLPWARPTFPVFAFLVVHPDQLILIDTGVGVGNPFIDELYTPVHHDLDAALRKHGATVDDIETVITSHRHFDHCGQTHRFSRARIIVQRAEVEAAKAPLYTVTDWAFPPGIDLTVIDGDHDAAVGVRVIATPGHTPGHQSVVIDDGDGLRTVVCCQAAWNVSSFPAASLGDDGWDQAKGSASLEKLRALDPSRVCSVTTRRHGDQGETVRAVDRQRACGRTALKPIWDSRGLSVLGPTTPDGGSAPVVPPLRAL